MKYEKKTMKWGGEGNPSFDDIRSGGIPTVNLNEVEVGRVALTPRRIKM